ncbi:MAG TPA: hypothetical protein VK742_10095 [Candidatus Sulfotelmatobacter sp.]|jgi:hypothetical protein|nr:hypothetical protein [Candidatus Sulfotelmatobacter sp.]
MNAFVKKEVRLLLPNFSIAGVLALSGLFFTNNHDSLLNGIPYFAAFVFCPAVVVMLALSPFGVEVGSGTLANLLAQPVPRQKIWDTKIKLLAVALLVLGVLWVAASFVSESRSDVNHSEGEELDMLATVIVFGLVVFSGGLWTVLLLRQAAAAFWFTVLVPAMIAGVVGAFLSDCSGEFEEGMIVIALGIYSLAGFFFARWLFFRAQDVQWSGGTIVMPEMRGLSWMKSAGERRIWRPRAALWRKEFQLHQSQYIMAFVLLVMHLGVLAARKFGNFHKNSETEFVLEIFWGLWMVLPLLVGCTAVAEERKFGTLTGQLCVPAKLRTQFSLKLITVLGLSIFFGAVMPLLLEGSRILSKAPEFHYPSGMTISFSSVQWNALFLLQVFYHSLPVLLLGGIAALSGLISFYASSLARNTLQSLAPAVLGILGTMFLLISGANLHAFGLDYLWYGPLYFFVGGPLLLVALVWFAANNFRQLSADGKLWARNGLYIFLAVAVSIIATTGVYHRFWEKFTPFEPAHGAARLSLADSVKLQEQWIVTTVLLPGRNIWQAAEFPDEKIGPLDRLLANGRRNVVVSGGVGGSNWLTAGGCLYSDWVGIKTDGTLWVSAARKQSLAHEHSDWRADLREVKNLVQFGTETNWSSIVQFPHFSFLTKTDGTLWRWSYPTNFDYRRQSWPGLQMFTPERLGVESNWAEVILYGDSPYFLKADGSLWSWYVPKNTNGVKLIQIDPDLTVTWVGNFRGNKLRITARVSYGKQFEAGVFEDGTFRVWAEEDSSGIRPYSYDSVWKKSDLLLEGGTNWLAVAGRGEKIVTLRNDGTLWLWNFHYDYRRGYDYDKLDSEMMEVKPVRLGTHSDWIAVSGYGGSVTALAADGSLWYWPLSSVGEEYESYVNSNQKEVHPLIDSSRKPQLLGNVFAATP